MVSDIWFLISCLSGRYQLGANIFNSLYITITMNLIGIIPFIILKVIGFDSPKGSKKGKHFLITYSFLVLK